MIVNDDTDLLPLFFDSESTMTIQQLSCPFRGFRDSVAMSFAAALAPNSSILSELQFPNPKVC